MYESIGRQLKELSPKVGLQPRSCGCSCSGCCDPVAAPVVVIVVIVSTVVTTLIVVVVSSNRTLVLLHVQTTFFSQLRGSDKEIRKAMGDVLKPIEGASSDRTLLNCEEFYGQPPR